MLTLSLLSAPQLAQQVADRVRAARLRRAWTQQELADRSGMSLSSLRRFERTGEISFMSLVRIAISLDLAQNLETLFSVEPQSMDDLLPKRPRLRGRRT